PDVGASQLLIHQITGLPMKQMKIALPDDLRARLDAASARSGRSIAEEVRVRVEASFARDIVADVATRDFVEGLTLMPAEVAPECGANWYEHAGAHQALTRAILRRLETLKSKGPVTFRNRPNATIASADPDEIGTLIEFRLRRKPDFSRSAMRSLLVEEQRSLAEMMGSPRVLLDSKPDQPKKGRKS